MRQKSLINVEDENGGKSSCLGCLGKLFALLTVGLIFLVAAAVGGYFFFGKKSDESPSVNGFTSYLQSLPGQAEGKFNELREKVNTAAKSDSADQEDNPSSSENNGGGTSIINDFKKPLQSLRDRHDGQRPQDLQDPPKITGTLPDVNGTGGLSPLPDVEPDSSARQGLKSGDIVYSQSLPRRGGSFGLLHSSYVELGQKGKSFKVWKSNLATAGSDLRIQVVFAANGGQIAYRVFLLPYDGSTHNLLKNDNGEFLLSFSNGDNKQLLPTQGNLYLPLSKMEPFQRDGKVAGWVMRGTTALGDASFDELTKVKMGWDFSPYLGDHLRDLKRNR